MTRSEPYVGGVSEARKKFGLVYSDRATIQLIPDKNSFHLLSITTVKNVKVNIDKGQKVYLERQAN